MVLSHCLCWGHYVDEQLCVSRILLDRKADPNSHDGWEGMNPLCHALRRFQGEESVELCRLLLDRGAKASKIEHSKVPLHVLLDDCDGLDEILFCEMQAALRTRCTAGYAST